jgi:preprotein translocase subunit YajC
LAALVIIVVLLLLMWVLLIRPQRRKQSEQEQLLSNLQVGDEVVTAGGLYGRIESVHDSAVMVEISPGTTVRIAKRAVAGIVTEEEEDEELEEGEEELELEAEAEAEEAGDEPELERSQAKQPG